MDGPPGQYTIPVTTAAQASRLVADYFRDGYDFIKVYGNLTPDVYDAIISSA